jgi:hypothetical protein
MEQTRQNRELDTRDTTQRVKQWAPAALLPEVKKDAGWSYRWIRTSMVGQADPTNVHKRMREGWEPVKLSDHPELQMFVESNARIPDSIEVGGLILCKTPEELVSQRNAYYNKQTESQTQAVDNSFMKENDARMPLFAEKKTEVRKFGKG